MKTALYLRVSTDGQVGEDRYGLAAQREAVRAYAAKNGLDIVGEYVDEGISGAKLDRPALNDLLAAARKRRFERVLVAKLDRLARDLYLQLFIEKELLVADVEVVSVAEPFSNSDPMSRAMRQIVGVFAELERATIAQRLAGGRREKARDGGYAGGGVPLGYRPDTERRELVVDQEKADAVRRAFEIRSQFRGRSLSKIAEQLNAEGYTTATGRPFSKVQVHRVLSRRRFYEGGYRYGKVDPVEVAEGRHTAIL